MPDKIKIAVCNKLSDKNAKRIQELEDQISQLVIENQNLMKANEDLNKHLNAVNKYETTVAFKSECTCSAKGKEQRYHVLTCACSKYFGK